VRALSWILAAAFALPDAPRGLIERVVCADHPDQSYAVYVPASAPASTPLPVLYLLDARGRALLPIQRFREAADAFGWILVSSYNSRSDTRRAASAPEIPPVAGEGPRMIHRPCWRRSPSPPFAPR
jgi:hypothetical protein